MNDKEKLDEAMRLLDQYLSCFRMRGPYVVTRTSDGEFVEVDEDLVTTVEESREFVASFK